jgi:hypothetical protein
VGKQAETHIYGELTLRRPSHSPYTARIQREWNGAVRPPQPARAGRQTQSSMLRTSTV